MGKKDDISITLESEESKIDLEIIKLNEKIKQMESSNKKMKEEFEEYKKIMDDKINITLKNELEKVEIENEKKIKHLENELIEKENYINELKSGIGFIKNDFTNLINKGKIFSSIINFGDLYLIEEGIKNKFNKKIKKCELLYRYSSKRYGDYRAFYNSSSNVDFIIILVMTATNNRFGGFSDIPLKNGKETKNSFCFSFDKQKLYYDTKYVEWKNNEGPKFENGFRLISDSGDQKCAYDNNQLGLWKEDFLDYEAHRIYLE
jgi:predicted RNase H-like nuclease (RuvC/YqgF family)